MMRPPSRALAWAEVGATYLLYQILVIVFLALPPVLVESLGYRPGLRRGTAISLGCTLVAEAIVLALLLLWMRRRGLRLSDLGWRKPASGISIAVAVAFGLGYAVFTLWSLDLQKHLKEVSLFRFWGVVLGLAGATVEEIVFRGFVLTELGRANVSVRWQVVISAGVFSLIHMSFSLWGMLATLIMGAVLAAVYVYGGRSLTAPVLGHALINALIEPWLLMSLITFFAEQK